MQRAHLRARVPPCRVRVPYRRLRGRGGASLTAVQPRRAARGLRRRHLAGDGALHHPRPGRPGRRGMSRVSPRHRCPVVRAPDGGGGPARIRAPLAPDRESLDRGAGRFAVDVGPRVARHHGCPPRRPARSLVGRREPVLARHLPDGEPQPGARPQRRIVLRLRLSGHAPRAPFRQLPSRVQLREARSGPGGAARATSVRGRCRPEFRGLPPPLDAAHSLRPQPGTPRLRRGHQTWRPHLRGLRP